MCERKGASCTHCVNGLVEIIGKPKDLVTSDAWDVVEVADGLDVMGWPNGRGWANEPAALVEGVRFVLREFAKIKMEIAKNG